MIKNLITIFKTKDLRTKILVVLGLLLAFRLLAVIPLSQVNPEVMKSFLDSSRAFGLLNIFTGSAFQNVSIAMLGVGPYITSSIILQLLVMVFPTLKEKYMEDAEGRKKFDALTRYITVPLAILQGFGMLKILQMQGIIVIDSVWGLISNIIILTAGSMLIVWFGDLITEKKMGNGISMIIFAGIVATLPMSLFNTIVTGVGSMASIISVSIFLVLSLLMIIGIVYVNEGERRVPVSYARHVRGNKVFGGMNTHLPLKVNQAGVIPIIFAISFLAMPGLFGQLFATSTNTVLVNISQFMINITENVWFYNILYFVMVFGFTFFYTSLTFDPGEISKNLQKMGGFIPGYRPGERTENYLRNISSRITLFGALFLSLVAILPNILQIITKVNTFQMGGTSVLIMVAVALEIKREIEAQLSMREYSAY